MEDMSCNNSQYVIARPLLSSPDALTLVFCLGRNLSEELEEVGQVIAQELDSNNEILPGVVTV